MPEGEPHARRPRFKLTGLEVPEELWDRLRESEAEIEHLSAHNAKLAAELDAVQRRLRGAGELTDDELMAELPPRMTRNLAAAQEVANDMIERARNDAMIIRLNADQVAAQLVDGAQAEADRIVRGTIADSRAQVVAARTKAKDLLQAAHTQRNQILADLDERSSWIEHEYQSLADHRHHVEQTYEQVATALAAARAALAAGAEPIPPVVVERREQAPARPEQPPVPQEQAPPARGRPSDRQADRAQVDRGQADRVPADRVPADRVQAGTERGRDERPDRGIAGRRPGVFDWSRAVSVPRGTGRPSASGTGRGEAPYAGADAAAG